MKGKDTQKKIAVFTGNRAEYGLQYPVLKAIDQHKELDYRLIVSGAHLDTNFGSTLAEIERDGFRIDHEVKIEMDAASLASTAQAIGSGILGISKALEEIQPDVFVVYADRFEGLAAVIAATQMAIPTAHIEGGDLTEGGALDDSVRHAMTKLSHLHFTTNEQATNRILGMGEEPWRVHTVGFPAIDLISEKNYASAEEVRDSLQLDLAEPVVLFTQHSVTTEYADAGTQVRESIKALRQLADSGVQVILTYPNNDAGGSQIIEEIDSLMGGATNKIIVKRSLGRYLYHGVLSLAMDRTKRVVCVGNSSSGLKETPVFGCPTVNIGSRQDARLRGNNVLDCGYGSAQVLSAVETALYNEQFRKVCFETHNPYGIGDAGLKIAEVLAGTILGETLIRKKMNLLGEAADGWFR